MLERRLAKNGEGIGQAVLNIGLRVEAALVDRRVAAPGGPNPVQPYRVAMSWPVPWGKVQAPANATAGAPAINASALAAAHHPFGPARVKNMPPNASSYPVPTRTRDDCGKEAQLSRQVKRKLVWRSQKT